MPAMNIKQITLVLIMFFGALFIYKIRTGNFRSEIINKSLSHGNLEYKLDTSSIWQIGDDEMSSSIRPAAAYKLALRLNITCSLCLTEVKKAYEFSKELSEIQVTDVYLLTREKSPGWVKYYLDKVLSNYRLWVLSPKSMKSISKVALLDKSDRVVAAGDIFQYPFLKNEYKKLLKRSVSKEDI